MVWADLCKLDYTDPKVHQLMAKVFLFWCRRHVDGFRCDAGYMLPEAAWNYIVARVREEFPDTVFLLEGLGGPLKVQERLLGYSGLTWGYSELFQNYTRDQISRYFPYVDQCSALYGTLVNFAETHDNMRLAASGRVYARLRFLVAAAAGGKRRVRLCERCRILCDREDRRARRGSTELGSFPQSDRSDP